MRKEAKVDDSVGHQLWSYISFYLVSMELDQLTRITTQPSSAVGSIFRPTFRTLYRHSTKITRKREKQRKKE